jgi:hypothetical protein
MDKKLKRNIYIYRNLLGLFRILGSVGQRFVSWAYFANTLDRNSKKYPLLANNLVATDADVGYVGDEEIHAFLSYKRQVAECAYARTESAELYSEVISSLSEIIQTKKIRKVLNFGCLYAHIDAVLATKFPDVEFHGIDRSPWTKILNEHEFAGIDNLKFFTGDAFDLMKSEDYSDGLLLHIRTAVVLSSPLVARLYHAAAAEKFSVIAGFEQFGISHQTTEPYVFSDVPAESVWWRGFMFIHNYPGLLRSEGWEMKSHKFLTTDHVDPDYRVFCFCAEPRENSERG